MGKREKQRIMCSHKKERKKLGMRERQEERTYKTEEPIKAM